METATRGKGRYDTLEHWLDELRERLRSLSPSRSELISVAERLPGAEAGLEKHELAALARGLERVWHIMRLLRLLSEHFGDRLFFGGGSVINYVYMVKAGEPPRLTFDLDSTWHRRVGSKRAILGEMVRFNKWLSERGLTLRIPVSRDRVVELYVVEHDAEKDVFPYFVPLRVPVITRYDGEPFYRFLGISDYSLIGELRRVFKETLGVRDPRIDYVRLEVGLDPAGMPRAETVLEDVFGQRAKAWITELEYQLAAKIRYKVAKDFGDDLGYNLHDILKAVLDLRLLQHVDIGRVRVHAGRIDWRVAERNLDALLGPAGHALWERNYHYTLVRKRYTLEEVVERIRRLIPC